MKVFILALLFVNTLASTDTTNSECDSEKPFSNIDGSCNNLENDDWGASKAEFLRMVPPSAEDCKTSTRKSPQEVCDRLIDIHHNDKDDGSYSAFLTFFGQFLDHDITLTSHPEIDCAGNNNTADATICNLLRCNQADQCPFERKFQGISDCAPFTRSEKVRPDQQNEITSYMDLSNVYGSDANRRDELRSLQDGKLEEIESQAGDCRTLPEDASHPDQFFAGDVRANENPVLLSLHSLFVFEHNKLAEELAGIYPNNCQQSRKDEIIFEVARQINIAQMQHIVKSEYLTELGIKIEYTGYDNTINGGIFQEFSTAAYRFGHSGVKNILKFEKNVQIKRNLRNLFFNTTQFTKHCLEGVLPLQWQVASEKIDNKFASTVGRKLFIRTGTDKKLHRSLCALNVQRGRDHKLGTYSSLLQECHGVNINDFDGLYEAGFVSAATREKLRRAYDDDFSKVDIFIAGLNEDIIVDLQRMGRTFHCILEKQFTNLIHGDRFYFENCDASDENCQQRANEIKTKRKMSDILCRNMEQTDEGIPEITNKVFNHPDEQDGIKDCANNVADLDLGLWFEQVGMECNLPN